jgi:hypothetical protein
MRSRGGLILSNLRKKRPKNVQKENHKKKWLLHHFQKKKRKKVFKKNVQKNVQMDVFAIFWTFFERRGKPERNGHREGYD